MTRNLSSKSNRRSEKRKVSKKLKNKKKIKKSVIVKKIRKNTRKTKKICGKKTGKKIYSENKIKNKGKHKEKSINNFVPKEKVMLVILDGFGLSPRKELNAVANAHMPYFNYLWKNYSHAILKAAEESVGLPKGFIGNSEVGHTNIGAGRTIDSDLYRVDKSIKDKSFFKNKVLLHAIKNVKKNNSSLHFMGLVSDGGVHSHINHLFALLKLAKMHKIKNVYVHCFLDGRDVPQISALKYINELEEFMKKHKIGEIATVIGRFYSMDRDNRWNREHKAYDAMVNSKGLFYHSATEAINAAYSRGETDEFVKPSIIFCKKHNCIHNVNDRDSIVFFNFRSDRAREITKAFVQGRFNKFERKKLLDIYFVTLTQYDKKIHTPVAFPPKEIKNSLGEVLERYKIPQYRTAETEKYAHVTYFLNCGREKPFEYEDRQIISSPKIRTYDLKPEMSAELVTKNLLSIIKLDKYKFIAINFANPDMVGHTGNYKATLRALEFTDLCLQKIVEEFKKYGSVIVTADHGNAEEMYGEHKTSHTLNPVPCILVSNRKLKRKFGKITQIAPTILDLMGIPLPKEMESSLLR